MKTFLSPVRISCVLGAVILACLGVPWRAEAIIDAALQMQLGNPSGAIVDTNNHSHYLIQRTVEALDYNDLMGEPNWAAWDLTSADIGSSGRSGDFFKDNSLPGNFYKVDTNEYSGSGFDRGHMCPSADRTDNVTDNDLVFLMSNIIPQAPSNNQGVWASFETYCRTLANAGNEVLIQCGPAHFTGSQISSGYPTIASYTWKVVVVVPTGSGTALSRLSATNRVIAIYIPNSNGVSSVWQNYVTNAHQIELETGFNFFTAAPGPIASAYRSRIDGLTPPPPLVNNFSPSGGNINSSVVISGTNFISVTSVSFHGTPAAFSVDSPSQITAVVPTNATSGTITVVTAGGSSTSFNSFNIISNNSPDLAVTSSHSGSFAQGDPADTYFLVVTNVGSASSSGAVSVSNALPAGLTATGMAGTGWTVDLPNLTATRADALGAGSAFPVITLTVSVASNAPLSVTNIVMVAGGTDTNRVNNTFADVTTITGAAAPTATTLAASGISATGANLNGSVNPNNQPTSVHFEYGLTTNYGSIANVGGSLSGGTAQAVSAVVTNLTSGATYHFRVLATNSLGVGIGQDQSFVATPIGVTDLAVSVTHSGTFTQGDTNRTLTITVTNIGNAASSGQAGVTNALPASFTATAMSGTGWTINLGTLTATRSDSLPAGSAYPPLIVTVNVASNAPGVVTNSAIVFGGSDAVSTNNSGSDVITINSNGGGGGGVATTLIGWDVSGQTNFGNSPLSPSTNAANLVLGGLTRGSGVNTNATAALRGWGGVGWTNTTPANAIASNQFLSFAVAASPGYHVSFSSVSKFDYRRSGTGPATGVLQYQLGTNAFVDVTNLSYTVSVSTGGSLGPIDLSLVAALQNVGAGTNVTFRIVNYGGGPSGTWYIFDVASNSAPDLALVGTVASNAPAATAPTITTQPASQTNNSSANVTFSVVASGTSPLSYQWRFNNIDLTGATASSYAINNAQNTDAGNYLVLITNVAGAVTSSVARLVVISQPVLMNPSFTNQVFTFTLSGTPGFNYGVESSTNLIDWIPAGTVSNTTGQVSFSETNAGDGLLKAFRARLLP